MANSGKKDSLAARLAQGGIVGAAGPVFARLGFAATRVEDILEASAVARRTFYKHFSNKEEVLAAVYEVATSELLKAVSQATSPDPLHAIRTALDAYLDYHVENAALLRVLVEQAIRSESLLAPARQRFRSALVHSLDQAVRATTGEEHDPMLYAALISALEGLSLDLLTTGAGARDVERAKQVMHLIVARALLPARA